MKATSATCIAFLCVCLVQSSYGRLSVFRQDITGIPGVEGHSYTVVQDGPNGPEQVARLHAFLATDQQTPSVIGGLFPAPFEWVSKQLDMVHAFQSQLMLDSPPDATPTPLDDNTPMAGLLQRVKCQRMRQAMVDDATAQRMWLEPGMSSSAVQSGDGQTEPSVGAGMMDDLVTPLNDIYTAAPATNTQTECFDNAGLLVPCDFDDTQSVMPWDALELPAGASVTSEDEGEQTDLLPGATWQMREGGEGEAADGSMWETEEREAEEVEGRLGDEDVDSDDSNDVDDVEDRAQGAWGRGAMESSEGVVGDDDAEWMRDDRYRLSDREDNEEHDWGHWSDHEDYTDPAEHPPPPPMLLVVAGALVAVGLAFLLLKALRTMHGRCAAGHGWKCCRARREQFLQAPLLQADVYGVKVAAVEAADDDVKGIDTSVALMKGEPSGLSR